MDQVTTATDAKGLAVEEVKTYTHDANGSQTAVESARAGIHKPMFMMQRTGYLAFICAL